MGSLFEGSGESIADPGAVEAWNTAKGYHQNALGGIDSVAGGVSKNPAYSGQRVADLNSYQTGAANTLGAFSANTSGMANDMVGSGLKNMMAGDAYGANAGDIYGRASGDPTQQIISQAGMYANNPYVDGMIDASSRDVMRQFGEQTMPGLDRTFAGTGNTNSTRAGVESAIAQRGAVDRLADISSGIRGQFFNQGLGMAQGQYNQNLSNMLSANNGMLQAGQYGAGLMNMGQGFAGTSFDQGQAAGGLYQNQNQNIINGNMAQFDETWKNPIAAYTALSNAAANTQAKTSAGTVESPSVFSQVASGVGAVLKPSDVNMKENIREIGHLPSGLSVYQYEYKPEFKEYAGHGQHVGVMAQEAKEMFPDAVLIGDNGYLHVDYSKIH